MKHYEIMYIIPLKVGTDEASTEVQDKVRAFLLAEGTQITNEDNWGKKKLSYPIDHVRHGTYVVIQCELDSAKVQRVSEWLRLSADILRAQLIAVKLKSPEQLAREKALQEKLQKLHVRETETTQAAAEAASPKARVTERPKIKLEDLDKKLEQILEQEMVR